MRFVHYLLYLNLEQNTDRLLRPLLSGSPTFSRKQPIYAYFIDLHQQFQKAPGGRARFLGMEDRHNVEGRALNLVMGILI